MKRLLILIGAVLAVLAGIVFIQNSSATSEVLWELSRGGAWLLPLVLAAAVLDSVHPCSFSILLITIAFLFGMQMPKRRILAIGGIYVAGIFAAYFLIGIGALQVLHIFSVPHFMGKLGASLLILFGVLNLINRFFPAFPLKLKIPSFSRVAMGRLMERASFPAAFALGLLVGICQFPCMGGPYLMVIGLLYDRTTYAAGLSYLVLYNALLILPLLAVLFIAADAALVGKMQEWRRTNLKEVRLYAGIAMVIIGTLIFYL